MIVYCEKCQLLYASPERLFWNNCVRCEGKLITEVRCWLMVIERSDMDVEQALNYLEGMVVEATCMDDVAWEAIEVLRALLDKSADNSQRRESKES